MGKPKLRRELFKDLSGDVLEVGIGTGLNIPYYPPQCRLVGIDFSAGMLEKAQKRSQRIGRPIELYEMDVTAMSFPDQKFDTIIATFLLCALSPEKQLKALRELARICKPTGEIRWLDYSLSQRPIKRVLMRAWTPWLRMVYGATYDHQIERHVAAAGLEVLEERFVLQDVVKLVVARPANGHSAAALHAHAAAAQ